MQIEELNTNYTNSIKDFSEKFGNSQEVKNRLQDFSQFGLPTTKNEAWKYTALSKFLPAEILFPTKTSDKKLMATDLLSQVETFTPHQIIFFNGKLQTEMLPDGVEVLTENFETEFAKAERIEQDQLEILNQIGSETMPSYHLKVSNNIDIDLIHIFDSESLDLIDSIEYKVNFFNPRLKITVDKSKSLKVMQQIICKAEVELWINPTFVTKIGANSQLEWNLNSQLNQNQILTYRMHADILRDGNFKFTQNSHSEKLSRHDFIVNLLDENATADLGGFYQVKDKQHHDTTLIINHYKSHTNSHQLFKGILDDDSRAVFNGMVYIHPNAQKVDATQLNKNLLLSPKAHVDTRPQLQVYADDVKAAHGATVGQLDEDELFYLMARGIPQTKATALLLAGYGGQVWERVSHPGWKEFISRSNKMESVWNQ